MAGRPQSEQASRTADQDLARAVSWWRATLSVPFTSYVQTRDDLARAKVAAREPTKRLAPDITALEPGHLLVAQVIAACEIAPADRQALLEHQDLPWLAVASVSIPATPDPRVVGLVPVTFILADPLTSAEQAQLSARQAHRLAAFDARVHASYATLQRLTVAGADSAAVLSVLVRFAEKTGGAFPTKPGVSLQSADFEQVMTHGPGAHPLAWRTSESPVLASRLEAHRRVTVLPGPARRGPAEMTPTVAMALLARHFRQTTGEPHWFDIADLFNIFAPQLRSAGHLTREQVRRRVGRIHTAHREDFERFARAEDQFHQALRAARRHTPGTE
jgi:hypothetical protein